MASMAETGGGYPLRLNVDYPERLDRLTTFFRIFWLIPIFIVLGLVPPNSGTFGGGAGLLAGVVFSGGLLVLAPGVMILFRQKYPRWWFDWNVELLRFTNRVGASMALLTDDYPSTDEEQAVHVEVDYPNVERDLNRWLPLVKWLLAFPHYVALFFLAIAEVVVLVIAWFAILFTGRYPRVFFDFIVGVARWQNRVAAYAFLMVTDEYPPMSLS